MKNIIPFASALLICACATDRLSDGETMGAGDILTVPDLYKNSGRYNRKTIRVVGYLDTWLGRGKYLIRDSTKASCREMPDILVRLPKRDGAKLEKLLGHEVVIEGIFQNDIFPDGIDTGFAEALGNERFYGPVKRARIIEARPRICPDINRGPWIDPKAE